MQTYTDLGHTVTAALPSRVLLILFHEQQRNAIESGLHDAGLEVFIATDQESALRLILEKSPQVIIVDSALPGFNEMLRSIRTELNMPGATIISLSDKQTSPDIARIQSIGVDVDLQKPIAVEMLLSKIASVRTRTTKKYDRGLLTAGAIKMYPEEWLVYANGRIVNLTQKEFQLLRELMEARGRVLVRETLLERLWGYDEQLHVETRTLDVHMSRLRAKLGPCADSIITVRSVGYRMNVGPDWLSH